MAIPKLILAAIAGACGGAYNFSLSWSTVADIGFMASSAFVNVHRDGDITFSGANAGDSPGPNDWVQPRNSTIGDAFECRWTVNSGDALTAGTPGTWQAITATRTFGYSVSGINTKSGNHTLEIRRTSTGIVVASVTFNMSVEGTA